MKDPGWMWFRQTLSDHDLVYSRVSRSVTSGSTPYQQYQVWESPTWGRCVAIDGDLQSTQLDCPTYHEALVHPALLLHAAPKTVLICGGGEGATAREVLKHPCIERVVMVDIDREFTETCLKYLPSWHVGAFDDPRLDLQHQDIFEFIGTTEQRFDVVIGDLTDLIEEIAPGKSFHSSAFYRSLRDLLRPQGVLVSQASALSLIDSERHRYIRRSMGEVFSNVWSYRVQHDSFFVPWSFVVARDEELPGPMELIAWFSRGIEERDLDLEHFDGPSLAACFLLAPRIRRQI